MNNPAQDYPISDLSTIFPDMTPDEYEGLKASIRDEGLHDAITVWNGQILDGRHRYQACLELGVTPRFEHLPDNVDPVGYVIARNVARRHLTTNLRAVIAGKLSQWSRPGGDRKSEAYHLRQNQYAKLHNGLDQREASWLLGVSPSLTRLACRVLADDSPAIPEVRAAVERDQIKVSDAAKVIDQPGEVQEQALMTVQRGEARTITAAVKAIVGRHPEGTSRPQPAGPYRTIVVDPPWSAKDLDHAAEFTDQDLTEGAMTIDDIAAMKLPMADDAFVFLWTTQEHLPQALMVLEQWKLTYRFTMVWLKCGGIQPPNSCRHDVEFVVVGSKGAPRFINNWSISAAINEPCDNPSASHSVKPKAFYDRLRGFAPGPRLELPEEGIRHLPVWRQRPH